MMTCGQALTRLLHDRGVDTVFGIPGVHTVELYRGLESSGIRHITPRHEQGAGFMADGYARVTGKPGVCFVITGPGMTNILTAMGQAYADSIPMLVVSSVNRTPHLGLGEGRLHELKSQQSVAAGVSAFSHTVLSPEQLPHILDLAFAVFSAGRPRPVHVELPLDVMTAPAGMISRSTLVLPAPPGPCPRAIDEAAELLSKATRPIVILGGGAINARDEARALIALLDAPVVNTVNAKGLIPGDHPALIGANMAVPAVREALQEADVVLAVGTEFGETEMYPEPIDLKFSGRLIRIDIDRAQLMHTCSPTVAIQSDARLALAAMVEALQAKRCEPTEGRGARVAQRIRAALAATFPPEFGVYERLMMRVAAALPDAIWVGDSTQPVYAANQFFRPDQPRSFFNSTTGYGTLGYSLPAAIGAKLAAPQRPVICVIGDGGVQFTLAELSTAIEASAPIVILLWNNGGYGEIKKSMIASGITPIGVDLYTPDFVSIARGFGCIAQRAEGLDHLIALLSGVDTRRVPTVIEIKEDEALSWQ